MSARSAYRFIRNNNPLYSKGKGCKLMSPQHNTNTHNAAKLGSIIVLVTFIWLFATLSADASKPDSSLDKTTSHDSAIRVQEHASFIEPGSVAGSCLGGWQVMSSPSPQDFLVILEAVDALSSN